MKNNDYANTVVQILARITPIRDFFLMPSNYADCRSLLVQHFGELLRKVWNPRNFKGQVRAICGWRTSEPADGVLPLAADAAPCTRPMHLLATRPLSGQYCSCGPSATAASLLDLFGGLHAVQDGSTPP